MRIALLGNVAEATAVSTQIFLFFKEVLVLVKAPGVVVTAVT